MISLSHLMSIIDEIFAYSNELKNELSMSFVISTYLGLSNTISNISFIKGLNIKLLKVNSDHQVHLILACHNILLDTTYGQQV